jgi:hypothetical protein
MPPAPGVVDAAFASHFAAEWIAAWNSHDLDRILSHYTDDFEMRSPLIIQRGFDVSGVLRGKTAVGPYWRVGLQATPPIRFELIGVYAGIGSIAIHYLSVGRRIVIEVVELDATGKVTRGQAIYGPAAG